MDEDQAARVIQRSYRRHSKEKNNQPMRSQSKRNHPQHHRHNQRTKLNDIKDEDTRRNVAATRIQRSYRERLAAKNQTLKEMVSGSPTTSPTSKSHPPSLPTTYSSQQPRHVSSTQSNTHKRNHNNSPETVTSRQAIAGASSDRYCNICCCITCGCMTVCHWVDYILCTGEPLHPQANPPRKALGSSEARKHPQQWYDHACSTMCSEPCCFLVSTILPCCTAFDLRRRALGGHFERYICCQGTGIDPQAAMTSNCPMTCLMLESFLCCPCAVGATRSLVSARFNTDLDPCDNRIMRCNNCVCNPPLWCSMCCIPMDDHQRRDVVRQLDVRKSLNLCGRFAYLLGLPCFQVQTWLQLSKGSMQSRGSNQVVHLSNNNTNNQTNSPDSKWSSPRRENYRKPQEPTVVVVDKQPQRRGGRGGSNKVHPLDPSHPLAGHLNTPVKEVPASAEEDEQVAATRALWSTSVINRNSGKHSFFYDDTDSTSTDDREDLHRGSPHNRSRRAKWQRDDSDDRGGHNYYHRYGTNSHSNNSHRSGNYSSIRERNAVMRDYLKGRGTYNEASAARAAKQEEYEVMKLQDEATARGQRLKEERLRKENSRYDSGSKSTSTKHKKKTPYANAAGRRRKLSELEDEKEREATAATLIQASYRGHRARQQYQQQKRSMSGDENVQYDYRSASWRGDGTTQPQKKKSSTKTTTSSHRMGYDAASSIVLQSKIEGNRSQPRNLSYKSSRDTKTRSKLAWDEYKRSDKL